MPLTSASINEIMGLGFAGSAKLGIYNLMIRSSSVSEDRNWIKSSAGMSTLLPSSTGEILVANTPSLSVTFNCDMTPNSVEAVLAHIHWRKNNQPPLATSFIARIANGNAYTASEAYVDKITLSATDGQLGQVSFVIKTFWHDFTEGEPTPRLSSYIDPTMPEHVPVPYWETTVEHPCQTGVPLSWSLSFSHGYQFYQFCEATEDPPKPGGLTVGPLMTELNYTTLSLPETITVFEALNTQVFIKDVAITLPYSVLDPSTIPLSYGEQNSPIKWQASWKVIGASPE